MRDPSSDHVISLSQRELYVFICIVVPIAVAIESCLAFNCGSGGGAASIVAPNEVVEDAAETLGVSSLELSCVNNIDFLSREEAEGKCEKDSLKLKHK